MVGFRSLRRACEETLERHLARAYQLIGRGAATRSGRLVRSGSSAIHRGHVDKVLGFELQGWAANLGNLDQPVTVDVYVHDRRVASIVANEFRQDLKAAGIGDGRHAFRCRVPDSCASATEPASARIQGTDVLLQHAGSTAIELDRSVFLDFIVADIVNNCNLRCPFCVVDYSTVTKTQLMSEATFLRLLTLIQSVPRAGFFLSCLHEPTLHPRLNDFLALIPRDYRSKVCFTTNLARPLSDEFFAAWAESGINHINVSLDTMDPDLFAILRKNGRYEVFKRNLDRMADVFGRFPNPPKLRYITMAFRSNLDEIPRLVEHSNHHWLATQNEIRYTYNVAHITDDFRKHHYLHREDWDILSNRLKRLPYDCLIVFPPENGYEETIELSANYFDLLTIPETPEGAFDRPLALRVRPDGTLLVVGKESRFGVNIHSLPDPVQFFGQL